MYSSDRSLTLDGNFTFLGTQIGLYGDHALVIMKSGSLTAKGADLDGVLSKGFVVENGVELVEMEGQGSSALSCFDGGVLTLADGYAITSPQGGLFKDEDIYESDGTTKARYVIIENKNSANPYMAYDVWLGNKHVNSKNKADIFGDGKASFDPETNTLTLNAPVIPGISYDSKIYSMLPSLTVKGSFSSRRFAVMHSKVGPPPARRRVASWVSPRPSRVIWAPETPHRPSRSAKGWVSR